MDEQMLLMLLVCAAVAAVCAVPHERQLVQGVMYTVQIRTGDNDNSGTSAAVHITITGNQGHTSAIHLTDKVGGGSPFVHGATDTFHFFGPYVGHITSITLSHDNTHHNPGWYVDWVKITVNSSPPVTSVFLVNRWLAVSEADHQTHATFTPVA